MEFKPVRAAGRVEPRLATGARRRHIAAWAGRARALLQAARQVCGLPDYERYLAHCHEMHPDAPVLTREQFVARAIERRYGRSGPRCC